MNCSCLTRRQERRSPLTPCKGKSFSAIRPDPSLGHTAHLLPLDAERSLYDAQTQLAAVRVDAAKALVDVYEATGQGAAAEESEAR